MSGCERERVRAAGGQAAWGRSAAGIPGREPFCGPRAGARSPASVAFSSVFQLSRPAGGRAALPGTTGRARAAGLAGPAGRPLLERRLHRSLQALRGHRRETRLVEQNPALASRGARRRGWGLILTGDGRKFKFFLRGRVGEGNKN